MLNGWINNSSLGSVTHETGTYINIYFVYNLRRVLVCTIQVLTV